VVLAAGAGGVAGGTMHLVGHAAVKSLLFLAAGAWLSALGTKRLDALRGAARRWPAVGAAFLVGALALAGLPPLSLWVTKDEALSALLERWPALYALGLAASVVGAVYATKAVVILLGPPPSADEAEVGYDTEQPGTRRVGFAMRLPLVALAVPAAALGVLGLPPVSAAMARAVGQPDAPSARGWELAASAVGALTAAALTWWWGGRPVPLPRTGLAGLAGLTGWLAGWLAGWLRLEALARLVVVRPTLALARALARFDDHILDAAVEAVARAGRGAAQVADRRVEPVVDGAVDGVGAGARRLARLARRPQTGLAHQYYAQLAATVLLLALVFVLVR
jgi:NADH:ubiquinone oxidoreductase subunit 5 (subunit L)/multisubunit Na+/H+ antiporter MnhA subunit